ERLSLHKARGVVEVSVFVDAQLVDGWDVWMLQLARNLSLADEAQDVRRVRLALRQHALQSDVPIQSGVGRLVDNAGAPLDHHISELVTLSPEKAGRHVGENGRRQTSPLELQRALAEFDLGIVADGSRAGSGLSVDIRSVRAAGIFQKDFRFRDHREPGV